MPRGKKLPSTTIMRECPQNLVVRLAKPRSGQQERVEELGGSGKVISDAVAIRPHCGRHSPGKAVALELLFNVTTGTQCY